MKYEPIKRSVGEFFTGPPFMRKMLYLLLDLLLLRSWHVRKALRKLAPLLPPGAAILDAGSGFGQYTWRMARMGRSWKIKAVDINEEHIRDCTRFFQKTGLKDRVHFETADLTELEDQGKFDLILSVDVMEHIAEDKKVFGNFSSSLKDGGFLVISTPSDMGGSDVVHEEDVSFIDEHVRDGYSLEDISGKLREAGFSKIEGSYTYGWPGNISWRLSMKYPIRMLNKSQLLFAVLPFYYMIIFPVAVILNFFDLYLPHRTGTGLLIKARK
jgi:SAM-dependent methyltransferase